ncbi:hypothetical protein BZA70DRAFT_7663 [Myxozyma melibiosi]|uniref:3beta-hydroxysteroid 3-dehydrogenase n=1 Tax=Myxozyma melibiosi TaxID=54550 RepID=A0ABR1FBL5_9ASCO
MSGRKVAVITGANGGLGYAIACRLLDKIPQTVPLTIVVSTRHMRKAVETINKLRKYCPERDLLSFDYVLLDLGSLESVHEVAGQLLERYKHIDYLFLNAGGGDFAGIDWVGATKEVLKNPIDAMTHPKFKKERIGKVSVDGIGWVFQINILANYVLSKRLLPVLSGGGRVIFIGSVEAEIAYPFDEKDMQLIHTDQAYVDSKRELEYVHAAIAQKWKAEQDVLVYMTHPGICHTAIFADHLNWLTTFGMLFLFYVVRWLGSPWHVIDAYKGAAAPVFAAIEAVPEETADPAETVNYGSACDAWGQSYIRRKATGTEEEKKIGDVIVEEMEKLSADALQRINLGETQI